ncbi:MAG: MSHA biogenesis protein MshJ [Phenylobacterium sp.]|jgi:MSHA biogenesis protein MshJ
MNAQWKQLCEKTSQLQMREKVIMFVGVMFLIVYLAMTLAIMPTYSQVKLGKKQIVDEKRQINTTDQQLEIYQEALLEDPDVAVTNSINSIKMSLTELEKNLNVLTSDFISPNKMRNVLTALLRSENKIKVIKFNALAAVEMDIAGIPDSAGITLYQHGLKLSVVGSYFDLQRYMKRLESLPWRFYWKTFSYRVTEYPEALLEIEITTISNNERFIAI